MITDNFLKLWFKKNINALAIRRASELIGNLGYALPCSVTAVSGQMVTVKWEMDTSPWTLPTVTIPCAGQSPWNYRPTQIGDTGIAVPASVLLGQIVGTTNTAATFKPPGNLSALVFVPVGTKAFTPPDANAYLIQGKNGFIGQTTSGTTCSVVANGNGITLTFGSNTLTLDSNGFTVTAGGKTLTINSSAITADGIVIETHTHTAGSYVAGSNAVTGDSGAPA